MNWWTKLILNTVNPVVSTFGAAADVRLNECWGVQQKLPALHIWHLPEQIWHLLNDCLLRPPRPFFFLSWHAVIACRLSFFLCSVDIYQHIALMSRAALGIYVLSWDNLSFFTKVERKELVVDWFSTWQTDTRRVCRQITNHAMYSQPEHFNWWQ